LQVDRGAPQTRRAVGTVRARDKRRRTIAGVLLLAVLTATSAAAVPASLRSKEDAADLVDTFMANLTAGDAKGAYRLAGKHRQMPASEFGAWMSEGEKRRLELRRSFGLSLGFERVANEQVGERVLRISQLERFDKGALVWRFVFYRAENTWKLVSVTEESDLNTLFAAVEQPCATDPEEEEPALTEEP